MIVFWPVFGEMNFYKHHLGDYDGHTAHLTWDEDMAYTRLLRAYYRREKAIPDADKYRLVRASTAANRKAVDSVLGEFFKLEGGEWHNKRCDEEIAAYQAQAATNKRIAAQREARKTVNEPCNEPLHESLNEPSTNRPPETTVEREPNQIPEPEPDKSKALSCKPDVTSLRAEAKKILEFLNAKAGRRYEFVDANLEPIIARMREGFSADDMRAVVVMKCREWKGDDEMNTYLRPETLFGRKKFAGYQGQLAQVNE